MTGEIDFCGVFLPPLLVCGIAAMALNILLRAALGRIGLFRLAWHPALAELGLYIIIFSALAALVQGVNL